MEISRWLKKNMNNMEEDKDHSSLLMLLNLMISNMDINYQRMLLILVHSN